MTRTDTPYPSLTNHSRTASPHRTVDGDTTIVLGVAGSGDDRLDSLTHAALDIAGRTQATVHVVHAFTRDSFESTVASLDFDAETPQHPDEVARRCAAIRNVTDRLRDRDHDGTVRIELHGRVGDDAGPTIVGVANEVHADHVVVGGRRRSPTGKVLFGSTAQHVLLNADHPVTFVKDE